MLRTKAVYSVTKKYTLNLNHYTAQSAISLMDTTVILPPSTEEYDSITSCLQQQERTIDSDGNCMFRLFSKELFGTQCYHLELRRLISNFEEHNPQIVFAF